jgi:hypothetical protein
MAGSYLNIISFFITTVFYYLSLKPTIDSSAFSDKKSQAYIDYKGNQYLYLGVYFLLVMVVQFAVNTSVITSNCGGNISDNIGFAGFITFIPWTLIFGVILLVLIIYPGFKSAFADVIGYFYVSSSANKIITELLVNKDLENSLESNTGSGAELPKANQDVNTNVIEDSLNNDSSLSPSAPPPEIENNNDSSLSPSAPPPEIENTYNYNNLPPIVPNQIGGQAVNKKELEKAADAIVKICGNSSILINQMVPENFDDYWKILNPLKKPEYRDDSNPKTQEIKNELFELVTIRDNIGEAMWYIYTGLLVVSIIQMKIATRGCVNSQATMEKNYQQFLANEKQAQEAKANSTQTYTIT